MDASDIRVVGLDIGGSKTQALAAGTTGDVVMDLHAGSANVSSVGTAEATRQLSTVFDAIGRTGIAAVCAGAAGVDTPEQEQRLGALIRTLVPQATVRIVHDTALILAAAGVDQGIALIAGTGSVCWGRNQHGITARAGGWGYLLGDEGSGYWIGRQAVRHSLAFLDRGERPDQLAERLTAECGLQQPGQLLDHFYGNPERRYWAGHSRLVFELAGDGDQAATDIIDAAAAALVLLVRSVARRLGPAGPDADELGAGTPVILAGGMLVHQKLLEERVRSRLVDHDLADVRLLDIDPVRGALELARGLLVT